MVTKEIISVPYLSTLEIKGLYIKCYINSFVYFTLLIIFVCVVSVKISRGTARLCSANTVGNRVEEGCGYVYHIYWSAMQQYCCWWRSYTSQGTSSILWHHVTSQYTVHFSFYTSSLPNYLLNLLHSVLTTHYAKFSIDVQCKNFGVVGIRFLRLDIKVLLSDFSSVAVCFFSLIS